MTKNPREDALQWFVQKHGTILDEYKICLNGFIKIKVIHYCYDKRYFVEYWHNGYCTYFTELID